MALNGYQTAAEITEHGTLKLADRTAFTRAMRRMRPGKVVIVVQHPTAGRTSQANRYYWGVVLALISEHTGYEQDELHEYFKKRFNPRTVSLADGEEVVGGSTSKMDTAAFYEYVERIRRFAVTDLDGLVIPEPGEVAA